MVVRTTIGLHRQLSYDEVLNTHQPQNCPICEARQARYLAECVVMLGLFRVSMLVVKIDSETCADHQLPQPGLFPGPRVGLGA